MWGTQRSDALGVVIQFIFNILFACAMTKSWLKLVIGSDTLVIEFSHKHERRCRLEFGDRK